MYLHRHIYAHEHIPLIVCDACEGCVGVDVCDAFDDITLICFVICDRIQCNLCLMYVMYVCVVLFCLVSLCMYTMACDVFVWVFMSTLTRRIQLSCISR